MYSFLFLIGFLVISTTASSIPTRRVLDYQCWHEQIFHQVYFQSSHDRRKEYASIIYNPLHDPKVWYAPWSYPPTCTHILESIGDKLCVYTDTSFAHGRGISIFTTPSLAVQYASLPAFRNPTRLDAENVNVLSGAWNATPIPGKGIGMLASKQLHFKDRITAYTPAILAYLEDELGTLEREMWWKFAIEQLPSKTKEDFLDLTYVFGDERVRVQDIVKANTFQVEVGGVNHLAVFPETSRLNHACNPNAQYIISPDLLTHFVHATRPIAAGEEITISYTSPLEPISHRQSHLQSGFHFTCTCPRCTDPTSDTTLSHILSLQSALNDWSATSKGSPALADELLALYRAEGLEGFMDIPYGFAALAYNAAGRSEEAVGFAEKAKEAILLKDGVWAPNLGVWEGLLGDVQGHWSFGRRV